MNVLAEQYDHEILSDLLNDNYLRVNSPMKNISNDVDDYSEYNLENIKELGSRWWEEFGDKSIKFLGIK